MDTLRTPAGGERQPTEPRRVEALTGAITRQPVGVRLNITTAEWVEWWTEQLGLDGAQDNRGETDDAVQSV